MSSRAIAENMRRVIDFCRSNTQSSLYKNLPPLGRGGDFFAWLKSVSAIDRTALASFNGALSHYSDEKVRFLSSEFDSDNVDDLFLVPQHIGARWSMVSESIERNVPKVAALVVPPFWQMGPMFYHTCRAHKVPVSVMTPRNLPIARQLIKEAEVDMVVATISAAEELVALLREEEIEQQVRAWHVVLTEGEQPRALSVSGEVTYEYFIFPGVPIGEVDRSELVNGTLAVYPSDEYVFEVVDNQCLITSVVESALPLMRFSVSGTWHFKSIEGKDALIRSVYGN